MLFSFIHKLSVSSILGTWFPQRPPARRCSPEPSLGRNGRAVEEEGLGDRRLHGRALERLGDEKGRLRALAGQKPIGEGGDEDDRDRELDQNILDRIDARTVRSEEHTSDIQSLMTL